MHSNGYVYVKMPDHPRKNKANYVKRATLVLESLLGRYLVADEIAHHVDGNKMNDNQDNLVLMTKSRHQRHHAMGNQHWKKRARKID